MSNSKTEHAVKPSIGGLYYVSREANPNIVVGFNRAVCEPTNTDVYNELHDKELKPLASEVEWDNELTDEIRQMLAQEIKSS